MMENFSQPSVIDQQEPIGDVTLLLNQWMDGNQEAFKQLSALLYDELRRIAHAYMRRERDDHTLQPTALVNESFLRLIKQQQNIKWQNKAHFLAVAAQIMRRILVDYVRRRNADKRGDSYTVAINYDIATPSQTVDLVALDDALNTLAKMNPIHSRIVELHFFGGLTVEETAAVLEIAPRTVSHGWLLARNWLYKELYKR